MKGRTLEDLQAECIQRSKQFEIAFMKDERLADHVDGVVRLSCVTPAGKVINYELIVGLLGLDEDAARRAVLEAALRVLGGEP